MLERVHARDDVVSYREKRLSLSGIRRDFLPFFVLGMLCVWYAKRFII